MKKIIACLLGLASIHAMASGEIRYDWPSANGILVNNACVDGANFRSLTPVKLCTKVAVVERKACRYGGEGGEQCRIVKPGDHIANDEILQKVKKCVAYSNNIVTVPRTHAVDICTKYRQPSNESSGECLKLEKKLVTEGRVFYVDLYRQSGEGGESFAGTKKFTIPDCN